MYILIMVVFLFKVKPAFLSDIQFFGQSSRKRCLENASSSDSKRDSRSDSSVTDSSHCTEGSTNSIKDSGSNYKDGSSNSGANNIKDTGSNESNGNNSGSDSSSSECDCTNNSGHREDTGNSNSKESGGNSKGSGISRLETSDEEQQKFYCTLNDASIKPAIVLPFTEMLAPKVTLPDYPKPITEFYNPSALLLTYPELLTECERVYGLYKVC